MDSNKWTERAAVLFKRAKRNRENAEREAESVTERSNQMSVRLQSLSQSLPNERDVTSARSVLVDLFRAPENGNETVEFQKMIGENSSNLEELKTLKDSWASIQLSRDSLIESTEQLDALKAKLREQMKTLEELQKTVDMASSSEDVKSKVAEYVALVRAGKEIGLQDNHCPLCEAERTDEAFQSGLDKAALKIETLDSEAVELAENEDRLQKIKIAIAETNQKMRDLSSLRLSAERKISEFDQRLEKMGLTSKSEETDLEKAITDLNAKTDAARKALSVLLSANMVETVQRETTSYRKISDEKLKLEERAGLARRTESRAKSLLDATKRTAGEVLEKRLDLVMPLMSEFYQRLRPHPIWGDIDYKLRGDVQRSLRLKVGDELNPQFMYSSGQRRATGLAFLLAVNMSLSWSKLNTLMLDDPVQHIDDFRSIHLAETIGRIRLSGKQIICATEDESLADLMCRHMKVDNELSGRRITLATDSTGNLTKLRDEEVRFQNQRVFATELPRRSAV